MTGSTRIILASVEEAAGDLIDLFKVHRSFVAVNHTFVNRGSFGVISYTWKTEGWHYFSPRLNDIRVETY